MMKPSERLAQSDRKPYRLLVLNGCHSLDRQDHTHPRCHVQTVFDLPNAYRKPGEILSFSWFPNIFPVREKKRRVGDGEYYELGMCSHDKTGKNDKDPSVLHKISECLKCFGMQHSLF